MFVVLKGFHASLPGQISYATVAVGETISDKFTVTSVVLVAETAKEAFFAILDETPSAA